MNDRIKLLRKALNLSQKDFATKIGLTDTAISKLEKGIRNMSDQTIKSICREFNVNYAWLTEGLGDMFSAFPETILDELADEYKLDDQDKDLVRGYLGLSQEQRKLFRSFINFEFFEQKGE